MNRHLWAGAAVAALTSLAGAAGAVSLEEAVSAAYDSNPTLLAARAGLRATDETVNQARAGMRPDISAETSYGLQRVDGRTGTRRQRETSDPFSVGVTATQRLYDGGRTFNNVRAREDTVSAARARLVNTEQQVILDVVTAYYDVLRDQESVSLASNNVRVVGEQLRATRDRFDVGEVTRTDVSQAEARLAQSRANLASAQGQLQASQQSFRAVTGLEPAGMTQRNGLPTLPASLSEAVDDAVGRHPLVTAARYDERSAQRDVKAQVGGLLPTVSLRGGYNYGDADAFGGNDGDYTGAASVTVTASIPLYQGGAEYSRIRQAQAEASRAQAGISVAARNARRVVEVAWNQVIVTRSIITASREEVRAAQLALDGVREEAIVGSRTTLDVLDAEQELLDAQTRSVSARRDQVVAAYTLLAATGELTAADMGVSVENPYDPQENYERNNDRLIGYPRTEATVWEELWRP